MTASTVLIVEDDEALCLLYRNAFRFAGFDPETAANGQTALQSIDTRRPDIVVLDLDLPQLDGAAVFRALRGTLRTRDIPILIVTGADNELIRAVDDADVRILRKPLSADVLVREVSRLLTPRSTANA